jgi:intracellular sulfur oxidation DsrE/DsrF family protein
MKNYVSSALAAFFILCLLGFLGVSASAQGYEALKGVTSVNTIFDFRDGNTESALIHLKLVHDTFKDPAIRAVSEKPEFVVVFMDVSVLLLSNAREKFSSEEKKRLEEFDRTIAAMAKDGIRLEVCMFAAGLMGVKPESIAPEIHPVDNGWIASLGYQQKGYSVVPAY